MSCCLKNNLDNDSAFFIICGSGSEYYLIENFVNGYSPENVLLVNGLEKDKYDKLVSCCDVGLVVLDYRFTIPNFPSRILSYMENEIPVLVCSDECTDIGMIAAENGFGVYCSSNNTDEFLKAIEQFNFADLVAMGKKGRDYLVNNYTAEICYRIIMEESL